MRINNKYNIEQIVVLKTDREKLPRIVTRITINKGNNLLYELNYADRASSHYEFEIDSVNDEKKIGFK